MIEKALVGSKRYWTWIGVLIVLIAVGLLAYVKQFKTGLGVTGLSRDVPWGFYIAQFTFLVGVAASAVMVVLPYYLHNYKVFGRITVLGEFLAIAAVTWCMLFIFVDMGQPTRVLNVILHPTPRSIMFWDMVSLSGYLILNVIITMVTFQSERNHVAPPRWIKPIIVLSIPWAVSIHTVTAFLYSGLGARPFWLTAIMAPRFLASAFAAGPAILILLCLLVRRVSRWDPGEQAILKLSEIVAYAMVVNTFFVLLEFFTALYSDIPSHVVHFKYLYFGLEGHRGLVPFAWTSAALGLMALVMLLVPRLRKDLSLLPWTCGLVVASLWIDKGIDLVVAGFVPNPFHKVIEYSPTGTELLISLGVYAVGGLVLTVLYKMAVTVREQEEAAA